MANNAPEMLDLAFDLSGDILHEGYVFALWRELLRVLPWLDEEPMAGMIPLRGAASDAGMLLAKRSKLVLRLPATRAAQAEMLSGQQLDLGCGKLRIGKSSARPLQPYPTLHSYLVESAQDEVEFLAGIAARLREMEIACNWICGKQLTISNGDRALRGFGLVLHDLKPEASLQVQRAGIGENRRYGCGIFLPYRNIAGLD